MSPALPATVLVVLGLAGMAWWYERTRPSSRVLALVATLAALAAVGRLALAPIPNVQPTTDIVVLAGVALGAAPGFAVGAIAAVVSNVAFGQGPWTIWQMLAWGCCGLLGAGLGRAARGRVGRRTLAVTCALAGLLFGTIMNVSIWLTATGAGTHELAAVVASSAPFDGAHALGNLAFAFAFGPAMLVAIRRARRRRDGRFVAAEESPEHGDPGPRGTVLGVTADQSTATTSVAFGARWSRHPAAGPVATGRPDPGARASVVPPATVASHTSTPRTP